MASFEARTVTLPGGERVVIRAATPDDAAAVFAHRMHMAHTSEHNVTQADEIAGEEPKQREWIAERLHRAYELFIVGALDPPRADQPGVLGALHLKSYQWRVLAHLAEFGISVDESWRGRGLGAELIRAMLDWCRDHPNIEKVTLGVYATNSRAIRLYTRLGFREEARRLKFFKRGPGVYIDDIQMSLWVKSPEEPPAAPAD